MLLPSILDQKRVPIFLRLLANGIGQAVIGILVALAVNQALGKPGGQPQITDSLMLSAWLLASALGYVYLRTWQRRDAEALGLAYVHELRLAIFRKACSIPTTSDGPKLGPLVTRLTNDLLAVKNWVGFGIAGCVVGFTVIVAALIFMAAWSPLHAAAGLIALMLALTLCGLAATPLDAAISEARRQRGRLSRLLGDRLLGRPALQSFGRIDAEVRKIGRESERLSGLLVRRAFWSGLLRSISEAVLPVAVVIVAVGGHFVESTLAARVEETELAIVWLFVMGLLAVQLQEINRAWDYRLNYRRAIRRVEALLKMPAIPESGSPRAIEPDDQKLVLSLRTELDANDRVIEVNRGYVTRLSFGTRAERSQLIRRIARMSSDPPAGITIGGISAGKVALDAYRGMVGMVAPDVALLRGTIGGNLRKATKPGIDDAVRADLYRISGLPESAGHELLKTPVGEGGTGIDPDLSARTRLACALLREPAFLLVDDPTLSAALISRLEAYAELQGIGVLISVCEPGEPADPAPATPSSTGGAR